MLKAVGPEKFIALVTDNAANMVKMRSHVVEDPACAHLIPLRYISAAPQHQPLELQFIGRLCDKVQSGYVYYCRCMMHAFGLVIGSLLGHKWANSIVKQAQQLVTFFRASHKALKFLRIAAELRKITKLLRTANATRFTSVANMLDSVLGLEQALLTVAAEHPEIFKAKAKRAVDSHDTEGKKEVNETNGQKVLATIQSRTFWAKLEPLCQLLDPLTRVTQAVQAADATLASVFRYRVAFLAALHNHQWAL